MLYTIEIQTQNKPNFKTEKMYANEINSPYETRQNIYNFVDDATDGLASLVRCDYRYYTNLDIDKKIDFLNDMANISDEDIDSKVPGNDFSKVVKRNILKTRKKYLKRILEAGVCDVLACSFNGDVLWDTAEI
ncbi:MAG: hypothetical protein AMQ22_00587 [Candidatus Methanofastidiosum methylothiophilum]|uniref:Uncharacterized protein n=1 Tax=Candidatus Methanofastidiosum methylothiophilum TaxID=1705564 RepID=A0A150J6F1_9EURY|nr:MAG: hypothetical protein AMQ22_00587 [Candidatus Methanofastidiosum methylthiophilus]